MNKKIIIGIVIVLAIIVSLVIIWFNLTNVPSSEGRIIVRQSGGQSMLIAECADPSYVENTSDYIIVRQSGGQSMLIAECADPSYVENTSDYIIEGEITTIESKWNPEHNFIYTYSYFTIEKYIKGEPLEYDKIQIITDGGCILGICQGAEDSPIMDTGKKRLYLTETNGEFRIHGCGGIKTLESASLPQGDCTENDNGFDIYNKATTKGLGGGTTGLFYKGTFLKEGYHEVEDYCYNDDPIIPSTEGNHLKEYVCSDGRITFGDSECRCSDGACRVQSRCPNGQIEHKGICKPKIIDLNLQYSNPNLYVHYLGYGDGGIYDQNLFNFNYPPLVAKANELVSDKANTFDKVKAIANYVYNSKIYNNTFNPEIDSIQSYWEMDRGKCFHAAQLTQAMLNIVGIPALHYDVYSIGHAQTLVNIDNVWGVIDTTFHKSNLNDPDIEINLPSLEAMREKQLFITGDYMGRYHSGSDEYCNIDNSLCLQNQFKMLRVMTNPLYQKQTLFIPLAHKFVVKDDAGQNKYYGCELVLPYSCVGGCVENPNEPEHDAKIGYAVSGNPYPPFEITEISTFDSNDQEYIYQLIGYINFALPKNNLPYNYTCYRLDPSTWSSEPHVNMHPVAVYNFSMNSDSQIKIMWNNLQKSPQSTQEEFNDVINYIKSTTQDLGISI